MGSGTVRRVPKLEIVFIPYYAHGHMIPMVDMARLFASHGIAVTIITTTHNSLIFKNAIDRDIEIGRPIKLHVLPFPFDEVGLPEGIENYNSVTANEQHMKLYQASLFLQKPIKQFILANLPNCIVSDMFYPWTTDFAAELGIPRIVFQGSSYFALCCQYAMRYNAPYENVTTDTETFVVPGLPDRIELTRLQIPHHVRNRNMFTDMLDVIREAESRSFGVLMNSVYQLEKSYVDHFRTVLGRRTWHIGPVSLGLSNHDKLERGHNSVVNPHESLSWLDTQKPNSVVYISFGSLTKFPVKQLHEITTALEASSHPFIWVIRNEETTEGGDETWLPKGSISRGKCMIVRGWAPQVLILDHMAIGGFMTHCGWNSILESVTAGVPLITWPLYAEQFYNDKLVTEIAKIGVGVGPERWLSMIEDEEVVVKSEKIELAVKRLMDNGDGAKEIRERAKEFKGIAKRAMEVGGSSYNDFKSLVDELVQLRECGKTEQNKE